MKIQTKLLTSNPYSRPRLPLYLPTKLVIHWVGNPKSSALANRNYFEGLKLGKTKTYASAHYIVGLEGEVIQCIPDNERAYHAQSANAYALGIETCHPDWEGKFSPKTYTALITLCALLCQKYNLNPHTDLLRHYDVTGKLCPKYYVSHPDAWLQLKEDVAQLIFSSSKQC